MSSQWEDAFNEAVERRVRMLQAAEPVESWSCCGQTFTGSPDFISGARAAHTCPPEDVPDAETAYAMGKAAAASPDERLREAGELERFLSTMAFVLPNLNDTFAFACADTEKISVGDGKLLADFWRRHGWRGLVAIAAVKRKAQPLAEVAATPEFQAAYAELLAGEQHPDEDGEPWTLADEFEIDGQADALAAADRDGERIPDSEFVVPPLLPPDPITERMIDVADDAFRHGSSDEQAWRECLGDALHAVYPLIRERVMAEMVQGKVPAADREENTDG